MCVSSKRNSWRGGRVVMQQPAKLWPIFLVPEFESRSLRTSQKPAPTRWLFCVQDGRPSSLESGGRGAKKERPRQRAGFWLVSLPPARSRAERVLSVSPHKPKASAIYGRHEPMAPQTCRIFLQEQLPCSDVNSFKVRPLSAPPSSSLASFVRPPACGQKAANAPLPAS